MGVGRERFEGLGCIGGVWYRLGYGLWREEDVFTALLLAGFRWDVGYGLVGGRGKRGLFRVVVR